MKVKPCSKICKECGFVKSGATDTLYAETFDIVKNGVVFPCHMYLKDHSGNESYGAENLTEIKVCRGYVTYMKKHNLAVIKTWDTKLQNFWFQELLDEITDEEMADVYYPEELIQAHKGLSTNIKLNNPIGGQHE